MTQLSDRAQAATHGPPPQASRDVAHSGVRADIQGLRAIAVTSVVVFHFWPSLLPGGFTGVDVFFVVSGFLITGRILRDLERRTPLSFVANFWAARVRRILPAALLVLGIVLVASWFVLPESRWQGLGQHVFASALSIENWQLAREAVDYGAEGAAPSPVQHYWSLSVEEQFYLGWPLLLLFSTLVIRRFGSFGRLGRRGALGVVMGVVLVASLIYSFYVTSSNPAAAYFVTPARIWQLAAGGLIALAAFRGARVLPWIGLGLIAAGFAFLSTNTAYPGYAALLPTLGTCLVLLGGTEGRLSFDRLTRPRAIQWLGDVSYSIYLVHWPLIVLAPIALNRDLSTLDKLVLLVITLVLSALSYRLIEQPFRTGWLLRIPLRSWVLGAVAIAIIASGAVKVEAIGNARVHTAALQFAQRTHEGGNCFGAAALDNPKKCPDPYAKVDLAAAIAGSHDLPMASRKATRCSDTLGPFTKVVCHFGDPNGKRTLLLWGNSHASAWSNAVDVVGKRLGMKVIVASRAGCPASMDPPPVNELRQASAAESQGCVQRNKWVLKTLVPQADVVVMADLRAGFTEPGRALGGYVDAIKGIRKTGAKVVWLADVPLTDGVWTRIDGPECLQKNGQCSNPVSKALVAESVTAEMQKLVPDLPVIQTRSRFCDATRCYSAIGGVSVYFDGTHISGTYSRTLGPWLAREVKGCMNDPKSCEAPIKG